MRSTNRAVLDESSSVANGARTNAEMLVKLEERKVKIQSVLVTRLVVEQDFNDENTAVVTMMEKENGAGGVLLAGENALSNLVERKSSEENSEHLQPVVTQSTSGETSDTTSSDAYSHHDNSSTTPNTPTMRVAANTAASSCMDLKKYTHAINNYCLNDNNCNISNHSVIASNKQHVMTLNQDEECNICLSAFQVGDRIAWKSEQGAVVVDCEHGEKNKDGGSSMICRHVFHAECIERWLLVREGCPVCRRSYFEDESCNDDNDGNNAEEHNDVIDLERGDENNINSVGSHDVILAEESSNIRRVSGIVAVEE